MTDFKRAKYKLTDEAIDYFYDKGYEFHGNKRLASEFSRDSVLFTNPGGNLTVGHNNVMEVLMEIPRTQERSLSEHDMIVYGSHKPTPHKHCDLMIAFAKDPSLNIEVFDECNENWVSVEGGPLWCVNSVYRIKPCIELLEAQAEYDAAKKALKLSASRFDAANHAFTLAQDKLNKLK